MFVILDDIKRQGPCGSNGFGVLSIVIWNPEIEFCVILLILFQIRRKIGGNISNICRREIDGQS